MNALSVLVAIVGELKCFAHRDARHSGRKRDDEARIPRGGMGNAGTTGALCSLRQASVSSCRKVKPGDFLLVPPNPPTQA